MRCSREKIKILYIVSTLAKIGPNKGLCNIVKHSNKERYEFGFLTLSPESQETMVPLLKDLGAGFDSLNLSRSAGFIRGRYKLENYVHKYKPDIIQPHGFRAEILSSGLIAQYPFVAVIRDQFKIDCKMAYGTLLGTWMAWWRRKYLRRPINIIVVSKSLLKYEENLGLAATPILNGVDREQFFPLSTEKKKELRKKLGLPLDKKICVFTGRLVKCKNPATLIKGFLNSRSSNSSILLIVGDGPLKKDCQDLALNSYRIKFTGRVDNVEKYLQASDIFISTSFTEGLPNSVVEAMACGLGVCLSDIDGHRELLEFDREIGVIFKKGDYVALADALDLLNAKNLSVISNRSVKVVKDHLNAKIMSQQYQRLYSNILKGSRTV